MSLAPGDPNDREVVLKSVANIEWDGEQKPIVVGPVGWVPNDSEYAIRLSKDRKFMHYKSISCKRPRLSRP
jgi:hypothetical protein|eukprot:3219434-Prymnesium_polylepis.1